MNKQTFISNYLTKKLKNNKLQYGMQYLNLLANTEEKAEKEWLKFKKCCKNGK